MSASGDDNRELAFRFLPADWPNSSNNSTAERNNATTTTEQNLQGFSFGSTTGGFSSSSTQSQPTSTQTGGFSFGSSTSTTSPASFSFGSSTSPQTGGFSFGSSAPVQNLGSTRGVSFKFSPSTSQRNYTPTSGFSFGVPATSGSLSASALAPSGFSFGDPRPTSGLSLGASAPSQPATGFSFGDPRPFSFDASIPSQPATGFSFGGQRPASGFSFGDSLPSGFSFGNPRPATDFSFSGDSRLASGFSFGVPATAPVPQTGGFTFSPAQSFRSSSFPFSAATPTQNNTTRFTFGAPAPVASTTGSSFPATPAPFFTFGPTVTQAPLSSGFFGATNQSSGATGLGTVFGRPRADTPYGNSAQSLTYTEGGGFRYRPPTETFGASSEKNGFKSVVVYEGFTPLKYQSITMTPEFSNLSFEELRWANHNNHLLATTTASSASEAASASTSSSAPLAPEISSGSSSAPSAQAAKRQDSRLVEPFAETLHCNIASALYRDEQTCDMYVAVEKAYSSQSTSSSSSSSSAYPNLNESIDPESVSELTPVHRALLIAFSPVLKQILTEQTVSDEVNNSGVEYRMGAYKGKPVLIFKSLSRFSPIDSLNYTSKSVASEELEALQTLTVERFREVTNVTDTPPQFVTEQVATELLRSLAAVLKRSQQLANGNEETAQILESDCLRYLIQFFYGVSGDVNPTESDVHLPNNERMLRYFASEMKSDVLIMQKLLTAAIALRNEAAIRFSAVILERHIDIFNCGYVYQWLTRQFDENLNEAEESPATILHRQIFRKAGPSTSGRTPNSNNVTKGLLVAIGQTILQGLPHPSDHTNLMLLPFSYYPLEFVVDVLLLVLKKRPSAKNDTKKMKDEKMKKDDTRMRLLLACLACITTSMPSTPFVSLASSSNDLAASKVVDLLRKSLQLLLGLHHFPKHTSAMLSGTLASLVTDSQAVSTDTVFALLDNIFKIYIHDFKPFSFVANNDDDL